VVAVSSTGGTQTHTLTEAQMPVHTHVQNSHNHTQDAHGHTTSGSPGIYRNYLGGGSSHGYLGAITSTSVSDPYSTNNVTATNQATTATNQNTGSGSAHTNTQPTLVLNYIIKATQ
jgi:microcystin-dependent protein